MGPTKSGFVNGSELDQIKRLPPGKGHWVRKMMRIMEIGQVLQVYRTEWNWINKTPAVIVHELNKRSGKRYELTVAADDQSWFIERLE